MNMRNCRGARIGLDALNCNSRTKIVIRPEIRATPGLLGELPMWSGEFPFSPTVVWLKQHDLVLEILRYVCTQTCTYRFIAISVVVIL